MKKKCAVDGADLRWAAQPSIPIMQNRLFPANTWWVTKQMGGGATLQPWFCPSCGRVTFFIPEAELESFIEGSAETAGGSAD